MLTLEERQIVEFGITNGKSKSEVRSALSKYRESARGRQVQSFAPEIIEPSTSRIRDIPSDIAGIGTSLKETGGKFREDIAGIRESVLGGETSIPDAISQGIGAGASTVSRAGADIALGGLKLFTTPEQEEQAKIFIAGTLKTSAKNPIVSRLVNNFGEIARQIKLKSPEIYKNIKALFGVSELAVDVAGLNIAKRGTELALRGTKTALEGTEQVIRGGVKTIAETGEAVGKKIGDVVDIGKAKIGKGRLGTPIEIAEEAITPSTKELTTKEFEKALRQRKIEPKTLTKPSTFILSDTEKAIAKKHQKLLQSIDPVINSGNVIGEIASIDIQVGSFLEKFNTTIWSKKRLKQTLKDAIKPIDDITIPEARLVKAKNRMVDAFVDNIPKNATVKELWVARKEFDRLIDFGSKALDQKMKRATRESVQDFISQLTNDTTYKAFMKDMRELFNILDVIGTKSTKEKGLSALKVWMKANPEKARAAKWIIGGGIVGSIVF